MSRPFVHLFVPAASLLPRDANKLVGIKACRLCGAVKRADGKKTGCRGRVRITVREERAYGTVQLGR